jgi:hypothetical protein
MSGRKFPASYRQLDPGRRPAMQARISVSTLEKADGPREILARNQREIRLPAPIPIGINLYPSARDRRLVALVRQKSSARLYYRCFVVSWRGIDHAAAPAHAWRTDALCGESGGD